MTSYARDDDIAVIPILSELRIAVDAVWCVRVCVRFLDRNGEVDVRTIHAAPTTPVRAGWEDRLGVEAIPAARGGSRETPQIAQAVRRQIEPERAPGEELSELRRLRRRRSRCRQARI